MIRRDRVGVPAVGRDAIASPSSRDEAAHAHQPADAAIADADALLPQRLPQPRPTVGALAVRMQHVQPAQDRRIALHPRRGRPVLRRVIAARTDLEGSTQDANREIRLLRSDEREGYSLCLAKKAVVDSGR
jgi:hypothetical protein